MKALLVARKTLLEILREPQLLGLELVMPLLFLLITKAVYNGPLLLTHPVWVSGPDPQTAALVEELQAQRYANGRPVFSITRTDDLNAAEIALKEKSATALIIYSPNDASFTIRGDAVSSSFYRASPLLESALRRYGDRLAGQAEILRLVEQPLIITSGKPAIGLQTLFDYYTPGMIIFAILLIIPQTAMQVARELRWRTLRRLRLTNLNAGGFLSGVSLAQMAVAFFQVVLIFWIALALGFHNQGSLGLAILVGLVLCFSAIGLGLVVACFVENDSQAANIGGTLTMLQVFLCGAMFPLPPLTLFTLAGHSIDVFDIFPATSGFLALQQVLSYGAGLGEIGFRLGWTLLLSGVYFAIGVIVFQRLQMHSKG